jgi:hypothetical protein
VVIAAHGALERESVAGACGHLHVRVAGVVGDVGPDALEQCRGAVVIAVGDVTRPWRDALRRVARGIVWVDTASAVAPPRGRPREAREVVLAGHEGLDGLVEAVHAVARAGHCHRRASSARSGLGARWRPSGRREAAGQS